jgi:hypothetical protein
VTLECPSTLCKSLPTNDKKTKAFRRRRCLRIKNCNGSSPATIINKTNAFAAFLLDFLCGAVWGHRIDEVFPPRCCHLVQSKQETNPKINIFFWDRFHRSVFDDSPGADSKIIFTRVGSFDDEWTPRNGENNFRFCAGVAPETPNCLTRLYQKCWSRRINVFGTCKLKLTRVNNLFPFFIMVIHQSGVNVAVSLSLVDIDSCKKRFEI